MQKLIDELRRQADMYEAAYTRTTHKVMREAANVLERVQNAEPKCPACGNPLATHPGVTVLCQEVQLLRSSGINPKEASDGE